MELLNRPLNVEYGPLPRWVSRGYSEAVALKSSVPLRSASGVRVSGRLIQVDADSRVWERWSVDSPWLHDAVQVEDNLFLLSLRDRNEIVLVDVAHGQELGRFPFQHRGRRVVFAAIAPAVD